MPGKKKATGMSTRQSFLDRNVIAENNAIMRFNEDIENAARGVSRPRAPARDRGREAPPDRSARPPRAARPSRAARPPALLPEQETAMRAAVAAATDDQSLAGAGAALVASLASGDRFERAGDAGWRTLAEHAAAGERSPKDWDRLRLAWTAVRRAALMEWVKIHPDAADLQEKEEKAAARTERAATRRLAPRRSRPRRPTAGVLPGPATAAGPGGEGQPVMAPADGSQPTDTTAAGGASREKPRRPRRRRPRRPASQPVPVEGQPLEGTPPEPAATGAGAAPDAEADLAPAARPAEEADLAPSAVGTDESGEVHPPPDIGAGMVDAPDGAEPRPPGSPSDAGVGMPPARADSE